MKSEHRCSTDQSAGSLPLKGNVKQNRHPFLNTSRAIHHRGLDPYLAAVGLDGQFAEGEAKSHSFSGCHFTGFEGKVLVENALVIGFGYSDAFIFNAHQDPALLPGMPLNESVSRRDSRRPFRTVLAIPLSLNPDGDIGRPQGCT